MKKLRLPEYMLMGVIFLWNIFPAQLSAEEPLKPLKIEVPPVIDGDLSDAVWQQTPNVTDFKTFMPDYGKDASEKTIAYMAYDNENLYFAYRCFETEPDKIKTSISSRDNILQDDWVCINLDSFNDQQSLTAFYINPMGIQADSRFSAGKEDFSIDLVWYSAGKLTPSGYDVEIQIPLKSLRYSNSEPVQMSIFFERYISRKIEHSSNPEMDPAKGDALLLQMKPMVYSGLKHYTLFELLPAITYSHKLKIDRGDLVKDESKPDFSLTAKYGITSDLIVDGTVNPDFSQVESDAGQVDENLRYALYYSEKRPFFLEGNEHFIIAATQASELDPITSIVHTRTIINPIADVKLTGKLSDNLTIASIYAADELPDDMNDLYGKYAHVPIMRLKYALTKDSYVGGIYAGTEMKNHFNRVAGLDEMYRLGDGSMIESHALFSQSKYYGSSDEMWGHALGLSYWKVTRDLDYNLTLKDLSEDFSAEMGYVSRPGIFSVTGIARPKFYPGSGFISRINTEAFTAWTMDKPSEMWETFNHISVQGYMFGSLTLKIKYSYSTEVFLGEKFETGGFYILAGGLFRKDLYASILYRRIKSIYYSDDPYQGRGNKVQGILRYQPTDKLTSELSFLYTDFYRQSDGAEIFSYPIFREKLTYQMNKYLFLRGIVEYNNFRKSLLTDILLSFTYIPGTVIHMGYGSFYEKISWDETNERYNPSSQFLETERGLFVKMSYLWRM